MPPTAGASVTEVTVAQWFVTGVQNSGSKERGPLRVYGIPHGANKQRQRNLWRSGSIVRRISSTVLETRFGTRIKLHGPIDTVAASGMSMTQDAINAFAEGFPPRWRSIAQNAFTVAPRSARNTYGESALVPAASQDVLTNAPMKSENRAPKRARSTPRIQMVTVPLSEFKPNAKKRRATEPSSLAASHPVTTRLRRRAPTTLPNQKKPKQAMKPKKNHEIHSMEVENIQNAKKPKQSTKAIKLHEIQLVQMGDVEGAKKSEQTIKASKPLEVQPTEMSDVEGVKKPEQVTKAAKLPEIQLIEMGDVEGSKKPMQTTKAVKLPEIQPIEMGDVEGAKKSHRTTKAVKLSEIQPIETDYRESAKKSQQTTKVTKQPEIQPIKLGDVEGKRKPVKATKTTNPPGTQEIEKDNAENRTEKHETRKETEKETGAEAIDLVTPPATPPDKHVSQKENRARPKSKSRFSVDSLLARREREVENGEPAHPAPKRNYRKTKNAADVYDFPEPTPVILKIEPSKSEPVAETKTRNNKKKKTEKHIGVKAAAKKSVLKKKKVTILNNAPRSTRKVKKSIISFKDQLVEVEEVPPAPRRASRRAARLAKAALAATLVETPKKASEIPTSKADIAAPSSCDEKTSVCNPTEWTDEQVDAYERMRDTVPGDTDRYWAKVAAGVPGRTEEECSGRFWDSAKTPEKRKNMASKSSKQAGKSTPEVAAKYAEDGVTKAHTKTAKFAQNMRRIVAANAREVLESGENVFVPHRVEGYSPATPKCFDWGDGPVTPGTEARERLRQLEAPKLETPEPFRRGATAISVADRIAAQFKKQFGHLTGVGSIADTDGDVDNMGGRTGTMNDDGLDMADVLRGTPRNEDNDEHTPRLHRRSDYEDVDSNASESEEDKII